MTREDAIVALARTLADSDMRLDDIADRFEAAFGSSTPQARSSVRMSDDGWTITVHGRSRVDLHRLLDAAGWSGILPVGDAFMERPKRLRGRSRASVARVLAIHYLSREGGGTRTLDQAAARWQAYYEEELPADWRGERARVLRDLGGDKAG